MLLGVVLALVVNISTTAGLLHYSMENLVTRVETIVVTVVEGVVGEVSSEQVNHVKTEALNHTEQGIEMLRNRFLGDDP